jgi:uncharacterized protein
VTGRRRRAWATIAPLLDPPPYEPVESGRQLLRRRVATALTVPVGAVLLRVALSTPARDPAFYLWTAAVSVAWTAGGLLSGPVPLRGPSPQRAPRLGVVAPVVTGLLAAATVVGAALIARTIPALRADLAAVLAHAPRGTLLPVAVLALANGAAEEVFFRGAVYTAAGRAHPVAASTGIYTLAIAFSGDVALTLAAFGLGFLLGLQRRATGGVLTPMLTHLTWTAVTLPALTRLLTR